jgi:hypothetical protein
MNENSSGMVASCLKNIFMCVYIVFQNVTFYLSVCK